MKKRLRSTAHVVSTLGHPLLTAVLCSIFLTYRVLPLQEAIRFSILVIGLIVLPITSYNYWQVKRGRYTNFDVSDRLQRTRFYPVALGAVGAVVLLLLLTKQPRGVQYAMQCAWGGLLVAYGLNN